MRIGSLFSGAGGLDVAVEAVFGGRVVFHCEPEKIRDKDSSPWRTNPALKVLAEHWPGVPNLGDITTVDWSQVEHVNVLCGGFPCQDISAAGRRAGMGDGTRSGLWSEFACAIGSLRPPVVVIENVRNILNVEANRAVESESDALGDSGSQPVLRALGAVLGDLSDLGYDAQWATVAASDVGACHRRERVFVVAHPAGDGRPRFDGRARSAPTRSRRQQVAARGAGRRTAPNSTGDGRHEGWPEPARLVGGSDAAVGGAGHVELLPTPRKSDGDGGANPLSRAERMDDVETRIIRCDGQWGKYEPVIRRWETLTRPAPSPTEPNTKGNPRLAAAFSEWMMGWPAGWVTDINISRNDKLRLIGNGVVPQQAETALRYLLNAAEIAT